MKEELYLVDEINETMSKTRLRKIVNMKVREIKEKIPRTIACPHHPCSRHQYRIAPYSKKKEKKEKEEEET